MSKALMAGGPFGFGRFKFGTDRDDMLLGSNANEWFFGFNGHDTIFARGGNDHVFGGRGHDRIDAGAGNDWVFGGDDNDGIVGGEGNDHLYGDEGNDLLLGGAGRDVLNGGEGSDKYMIRVGTDVDTIEGFEADDKIDLRAFNFASAQAVIDAFQQVGQHAILNLGGGDQIILRHTRVDDLHLNQFIVSDAETGPSSSASPYVIGVDPNVSTVSLLTVGDQVGFKSDGVTPWKMVGIPDGLGAFDNGDGTFTVLMNHELRGDAGVVREHGAKGAFVSKLIIDKTTLQVLEGSDLIKDVYLYNSATNSFYDPLVGGGPLTSPAIGRLCSADLPELSAFYNAASGKGTMERIFMNGEEVGTEGRAFAHIVTGAEAGDSYELAWLGKFSWENSVANPYTGDKTVVAGLDDVTDGQVYFYFGDKTNTGLAIEKAGLTNGELFGLKIHEMATESSAPNPLGLDNRSVFSLVNLGDVSGQTGASLETESNSLGVTRLLRPEDGAWDTVSDDRFYFVTTASFTGPSRLWAVDFEDPSDPTKGGTVSLLLDGTEGQKMMDNITVNKEGKVIIQEDPGNQDHLAKIWEYDPLTDQLKLLAQHDPDRFDPTNVGGEPFLTRDEESSGIIDVTDILGSAGQKAYLLDVQAHYSIPGELVEGGQLLVMYQDMV